MVRRVWSRKPHKWGGHNPHWAAAPQKKMYRPLTCYVIVSGLVQRNYISMVRHGVWSNVSRVDVLFHKWTESTFVDTWLHACCWHVYVYYIVFLVSSGCIVQMFRYASVCLFHSGRILFFPFFPRCLDWSLVSEIWKDISAFIFRAKYLKGTFFGLFEPSKRR